MIKNKVYSRNIILLIALSAISGSQFVFIKELANNIGAYQTVIFRILFASFFLLIYVKYMRIDLLWANNWKSYLSIGVLNTAIPFIFISYASLSISASYLAVIASTAPLVASLLSGYIHKHKISFMKLFGFFLGIFGIIIIGSDYKDYNSLLFVSVLLAFMASVMYAASGLYIRSYMSHLEPVILTTGSLIFTLPLLFSVSILCTPWSTIEKSILLIAAPNNIFDIFMLSFMCTTIAYILYFYLMLNIGVEKTLTVTFLSPMFTILIESLLVGLFPSGETLLGFIFIVAALVIIVKKL